MLEERMAEYNASHQTRVTQLEQQLCAAKLDAQKLAIEMAPSKALADMWMHRYQGIRDHLGKLEMQRQREQATMPHAHSVSSQQLPAASSLGTSHIHIGASGSRRANLEVATSLAPQPASKRRRPTKQSVARRPGKLPMTTTGGDVFR